MAIDLRTSVPAAIVAMVCTSIVVVRVIIAPTPTPKPMATEEQRRDIAENIIVNETTWATETTQNFPSDHWSQRDDFHSREEHRIRELTKEKNVRVEDVLRAIDDDIHLNRAKTADAPDRRNAHAVPCKPRPFYD